MGGYNTQQAIMARSLDFLFSLGVYPRSIVNKIVRWGCFTGAKKESREMLAGSNSGLFRAAANMWVSLRLLQYSRASSFLPEIINSMNFMGLCLSILETLHLPFIINHQSISCIPHPGSPSSPHT